MKKMSRILVATMAMATLGIGLPAKAAEEPSVDSIMNRYVQELGGKAAMEKIKSRVLKVKLESENFPASEGEIYSKMPNKQWSRIELAGVGTMNEGFDGTVAWAKTPWEALRVKSGDELAKVKRDAEFHRELTFKKTYPDLAYKGTGKVGEEEAYVLESKPSSSSKEKFLFSRKSGLLLQQESEFQGPQGVATSVVVQPRDYKTSEGLKYPSELKLKLTTGDQSFEFTIRVSDVKYNVDIDDTKFAKPSA